MGIRKFPKLKLLQFWRPITLCEDLRLRWSLKQHYSPRQEIFSDMWHASYMQGNQGNSELLVVGNQIENYTPNPSFGHNLCFKYPNGSCKPILDMYVPRAFQWYKELLNLMYVDPYNYSLKIWKSIETPTPKVGAHLGVWRFIPSHSPTLPGAWDVIPGLPSWPAPL
jgi:hypothetical protein